MASTPDDVAFTPAQEARVEELIRDHHLTRPEAEMVVAQAPDVLPKTEGPPMPEPSIFDGEENRPSA